MGCDGCGMGRGGFYVWWMDGGKVRLRVSELVKLKVRVREGTRVLEGKVRLVWCLYVW